jgi:threonine dehydratase
MEKEPSFEELIHAENRIENYIHKTPVLTSSSINKILNCNLFFKCENFQKVGAFKFRGAINAVLSLNKDELKQGVVTHSSGNFAAALSLAARMNDTTAYIVMPHTAPQVKIAAVKGYGGIIKFCEPTVEARELTAEKVINETGAKLIHSYDNYKIIEGHSSITKEVLNQVESLEYIISPVGGGGLISGISLSNHYLSSSTKVIGAEPKGADDAFRSLRDGKIYPSINPKTIADGLLTSLCERTYSIIKKYVSEIITVEETSIVQAMRMVWERMKIIVEPSASVPLAVVLENKDKFKDKRVGIIISGGNVDLAKLPWL